MNENHLEHATRKGGFLTALMIFLLSGFIAIGGDMTQEQLKESFDYKDGILIWKKSANKGVIGKEAGRLRPDGYKRFEFMGENVYSHRAIFMYHHGYMPRFVDHINRDRSDNRIENLREATGELNARNAKLKSNNKSGKSGVCWRKDRGTWSVTIRVGGKQKTVGTFRDLDDAIQCRIEAEIKYYGERTPA